MIAQIGVGLLGSAIAQRLLAVGYQLRGFDLDSVRCDWLREAGGIVTASASDALEGCDRLVLSLPRSSDVQKVLEEIDGALRARAACGEFIVIDTTTGDPDEMAQFGEQLDRIGVAYLDATVAGSSQVVLQGEAVVMAGGPAEAVEKCRELLQCFATKVFAMGPWGSGARMKLVVNLVLGLNRAVLAEGLTLARACGLDLHTTLEVLKAGPAHSAAMDAKGEKMITEEFTPQARLAQHLKDVGLILEMADRTGAATPLSEVHRQLLQCAVERGYADADNSAVIKAWD